jgi:GH24 family phage-related lysozyme (muramidase)
MDISPRGLALIKDYEAYAGEAYDDGEGVWTLGWGSIRWDMNTPVKKGDKCTVDQAEQLLRKEVSRVEDAIDASVKVPLTQGQADCLVSWGYNVGVGWINGKRKGGAATLIKYLNRGQYDKVPSELLKFRKGAKTGNVIGGLINRRKRELQELWFYEGDTPAVTKPPEPMPQAVVPDVPSHIKVVTSSGTAKAAGFGILATLVQIWNWTFGAVKEAGVEAVGNQQALGPFEALFKALGTNMGLVAAFIVLGTLIVVIMRKIADERS